MTSSYDGNSSLLGGGEAGGGAVACSLALSTLVKSTAV